LDAVRPSHAVVANAVALDPMLAPLRLLYFAATAVFIVIAHRRAGTIGELRSV
jgi:hypothetical protein